MVVHPASQRTTAVRSPSTYKRRIALRRSRPRRPRLKPGADTERLSETMHPRWPQISADAARGPPIPLRLSPPGKRASRDGREGHTLLPMNPVDIGNSPVVAGLRTRLEVSRGAVSAQNPVSRRRLVVNNPTDSRTRPGSHCDATLQDALPGCGRSERGRSGGRGAHIYR